MSPNDLIDRLFPLPSPSPKGCPDRFPGVTAETKLAVTKILKENHIKLHGFRDEQGLHNHMSHQLLAVFAMGGSAPLYDAIYKLQGPQLKPAFQAPEAITEDNYHKFLGQRQYYDAYLKYFHDIVLQRELPSVLEQYVFSLSANFPEAGAPGHMVNRLVARLFHPIIYLGYGLEFNIPGLVAEGLAQVACQPQEAPSLLVPGDFAEVSKNGANSTTTAPGKEKPSVHTFTVLERIMKDDRFKQSTLGLKGHDNPFEAVYLVEHVSKEAGSAIVQYAEDWLPDGASTDILDSKIEQLSWLATLLYGIGGWTKDRFLADFYIMHAVTSSLFLPAYRAYTSPASFTVLLRVFFRTTLTWYISRGRAPLQIRDFYEKTNPTPAPKPADKLAAPADANPWLPIVQQSLIHSDDHLPKTQRALAHFAQVYGDRVAGTFGGLDGAEVVDGTLFVRVAELTAKVADTTTAQPWHFGGFFESK